jgi:2'-5' RNA ligase
MSASVETVRLFVSLNLPAALRERLAQWQSEFRSRLQMDGLRWVKPDQIHLTLRFFGNLPRDAVGTLQQILGKVCEQAAPFQLRVEGVGCFPDLKRPRVVWVGVTGDLAPLHGLQRQIIQATATWGESEAEQKFHPHLTIARVKDVRPRDAHRLAEAVQSAPPSSFGDWPVESAELMQSKLSSEGAQHSSLATLKLRPRE